MEFTFEEKYIKISPKTLRFLIGDIKKYKPQDAVDKLAIEPGRSAKLLYKAIKSSLDSVLHDNKVDPENIRFKTIIINQGPTLKRFRAGGRGMIKRYQRRSSHIRVIIETVEKKVIEQKPSITKKENNVKKNAVIKPAKNKLKVKSKNGQKVNPHGFRVNTVYNWDSRWLFPDKKNYRDCIFEDIKIREGIMEKFDFAIITRVEIERAINKLSLTIHATKPGMIIGRGGKGLEDVKKYIINIIGLKKVNKEKIKIEIKIEPVKKPYLNAYYVAHDVSSKIARNLPQRMVVHQAIDRVKEAGAKGIKIQLGGRIAGATISRIEKYYDGSVPLSTIKANIDYAEIPSLTRSGYVGVKVWIYK